MSSRQILPVIAALLVACASPGSNDGNPYQPWPDLAPQDPGGTADTFTPPADTLTPDAGLTWPDIPKSDVPPSAPDIHVALAELGGACFEDDDCLDGWCHTGYSGGYCSLACSSHEECPLDGKCYSDPEGAGKMCWKPCESNEDCRSDQFCSGVCTPRCQVDSCNPGYACDTETGQCVVAEAIPCEPTDEVCDGLDNDCDNRVDEGCGPGVTQTASTEVIDLGFVNASGKSNDLLFNVSPNAGSFVVQLLSDDPDDDAYMVLWSLKTPSGTVIVNGNEYYTCPNRTMPGRQVATTLVPNTTTIGVQPGQWRLSVYRYDSAPTKVWVYIVQSMRKEPATSTLDLNLWFVATPGLSASQAPTSNKFQTLLSQFGEFLGAHGISLGQIQYFDVTGSLAQSLTIVDYDPDNGIDEHRTLVALSESLPADNTGLNMFFVQGFTGWTILGRAGGIPGPLLHGTAESGVVVSLQDYYFYAPQWGIPITAYAAAHELGHQLGLWHTSEQSMDEPQGYSRHDPIPDTPECASDYNGDGIVTSEECVGKGAGNLMFWSVSEISENVLSAGQKLVIHGNPSLKE